MSQRMWSVSLLGYSPESLRSGTKPPIDDVLKKNMSTDNKGSLLLAVFCTYSGMFSPDTLSPAMLSSRIYSDTYSETSSHPIPHEDVWWAKMLLNSNILCWCTFGQCFLHWISHTDVWWANASFIDSPMLMYDRPMLQDFNSFSVRVICHKIWKQTYKKCVSCSF